MNFPFIKATEKKDLLKKVTIFSAMSTDNLRKIAQVMDKNRVEAGSELVFSGKTGWGFYLIIKGKARVEKNGVTVGQLEAGDHFGEISVIDGGPRMAKVVAETEMLLLICTKEHFDLLIEKIPGFAQAIMIGLCKYIRDAEKAAPHS